MRWTLFLFTLFALILPSRISTEVIASLWVPEASNLKFLEVALPLERNSVRFAVIGDSGTGGSRQYEVADTMALYSQLVGFNFVLMLGDNLYGNEDPEDYQEKFEIPYRKLLDSGIEFYASLGNHDKPTQRFYEKFNMKGQRYYTFQRKNVRFFALDSTLVDDTQLAWLEEEFRQNDADWTICFYHHPIYSSSLRHGSDKGLREVLEPLFVEYGVNVVFSGHDHVYERLKPQRGVYYFVSGAAGKLRHNNIRSSDLTERGFDEDLHFMLFEIVGAKLYFQSVSRKGITVDKGMILRQSSRLRAPQGAM